MSQPFNPQEHLIQLPRRIKNKDTGAWETVHDDYLEVKWRLVMFRERYPHGRISTEEIVVDLDCGYARFKATVEDGEGGLATGYGTETKAGFADYTERAETRSLGRALAVMGFGTQFVGEELSEGEHVADAPVQRAGQVADPSAAAEKLRPSEPVSANGHTPAPDPTDGLEHPTEGHIAALSNLALTECGEDKEVYYQRIRQTMGLKPSASVAPRLLTRTMSMAQYMEIFAFYRRLEAQLTKGKETPDGTASAQNSVSESASTATVAPVQDPPADPSPPAGSSSAPAPDPNDAAERDRQRLRAEVAQWDLRVPPEEVEYIILRNPYSKARQLLWKCRRQDTAA